MMVGQNLYIMVKKLILGMFAAAGLLFATSCSQDDMNTTLGEKATVSVNLDLNQGLGTKSSAGEFNADKLVYAVYDASNQLITTLENSNGGVFVKENAFAAGESESVSLSLLKGASYTVVFWAQNSACDAYTVSAEADQFKVDVDYNGANNDETRDAFYASYEFTVEGDAVIDVVLKRPFAQVNLAVSNADWDAAVASGVNIVKSKATIKNAATSINLLDGTVSGETTVNYGLADVPSENVKAASSVKDLVVNDESFKWLSMSYILTDEYKSILGADGLEFTLVSDAGKEFVVGDGLHNVPVQRNWRTNIVGDVLTGNVNFNVSVDPIYYHTATVTTAEELVAAVKDRNIQVIKLASGTYDVHVVHTNGLKVFQSADPNNKALIKGLIGVAAPASAQFENLKFTPSDNSLVPTGHQYLDRFERKSIVPIYAAKVTFTGCEFTDLYNSHNVVATNYQAHKVNTMLEIDNCSFQGYAYAFYSRALVSVTNCTFDQQHPQVNPRAIFMYGLGDGSNGKVIFKNNKAVGKASFAIQMSSSNYDYRNINFDVRDNENFKAVPDGEKEATAFLCHPERDFKGCTFVEGSETFEIK